MQDGRVVAKSFSRAREKVRVIKGGRKGTGKFWECRGDNLGGEAGAKLMA